MFLVALVKQTPSLSKSNSPFSLLFLAKGRGCLCELSDLAVLPQLFCPRGARPRCPESWTHHRHCSVGSDLSRALWSQSDNHNGHPGKISGINQCFCMEATSSSALFLNPLKTNRWRETVLWFFSSVPLCLRCKRKDWIFNPVNGSGFLLKS